MRSIITFSFLLLLMMPHSLKAAVVINEIAWMGGTTSANHEWIELYNNSDSDTSVEGWSLRDGMNLNISLAGSIDALDYAVLERTSDESAPGIAFLIYTGALVNTGATLTLYNSSGEIIDQVAGGENWLEVGGDNITKETAQYTNTGWVTDIATPGRVNNTGQEEEEEEEEEGEVDPVPTSAPIGNSGAPKPKTGSNKNDTIRLVALDTELKLKPDFQALAYVNQPVKFSVTGSGVGLNIINSLNYIWNFGDTNTSNGKKATHAYAYPGTYVVTLRANFARHNQVVRQEITVLPVSLSITKNEAGDVQIHNDAPYDVELSGFTAKGVNEFIFPPDTIIIPRGTITIKASKLGIINQSQSVALFDQEKTLVATTHGFTDLVKNPRDTQSVAKVSSYQLPEASILKAVNHAVSENSAANFNFIKPKEESFLDSSTTITEQISNQELNTILAPKEALAADDLAAVTEPNEATAAENKWTYLALIGLLCLGFVGLLLRPNNSLKEDN